MRGTARVNDSSGKDSWFVDATPQPPGADAKPGTACDLLAYAAVRVQPEGVPALRHKPGPAVGERLSSSLLRHADDQTVVGLAAVLQAIASHHLAGTSFTDWGVLGAPRFLGRVTMAAAMHRFAAEGAWGLSPHLIPHRSLHALSGTVSQALKIHGPNFGVGGGSHGPAEAFLTAAALLGTRPLPGLWVVLTGWDPEPVPDREGRTATAAVCCAVALAVVPATVHGGGLRLLVSPGPGRAAGAPGTPATGPLTLEGLAAALEAAEPGPATWGLPHGGWLRLERARAGLPGPHFLRQRHGVIGQREARRAGPGSKA
jgi:hypothetical protein